MTAAFAALSHDQIHDASPQLNVIQRIGGSLGTAIVALVTGPAIGLVARLLGLRQLGARDRSEAIQRSWQFSKRVNYDVGADGEQLVPIMVAASHANRSHIRSSRRGDIRGVVGDIRSRLHRRDGGRHPRTCETSVDEVRR